MINRSSLCTCDHRARNHSEETGNCSLCDCQEFKSQVDLEKLRAAFNGKHTFSDDFEHDARLYVTALEHKFAQAVAVAHANKTEYLKAKERAEKAEDRVRAYENALAKICGTDADQAGK